jgi:hypothetical protein
MACAIRSHRIALDFRLTVSNDIWRCALATAAEGRERGVGKGAVIGHTFGVTVDRYRLRLDTFAPPPTPVIVVL